MAGPGLALRGPEGSIARAVRAMEEQNKDALRCFGRGMTFFTLHLSAIGMRACFTLGVAEGVVAVVVGLWALRQMFVVSRAIALKFHLSGSEVVNVHFSADVSTDFAELEASASVSRRRQFFGVHDSTTMWWRWWSALMQLDEAIDLPLHLTRASGRSWERIVAAPTKGVEIVHDALALALVTKSQASSLPFFTDEEWELLEVRHLCMHHYVRGLQSGRPCYFRPRDELIEHPSDVRNLLQKAQGPGVPANRQMSPDYLETVASSLQDRLFGFGGGGGGSGVGGAEPPLAMRCASRGRVAADQIDARISAVSATPHGLHGDAETSFCTEPATALMTEHVQHPHATRHADTAPVAAPTFDPSHL